MNNGIIKDKISNFTIAVRKAIIQENWYAALTLALTLPDICGKLERPNIKSTFVRYSKWFDEYMLYKYSFESFGKKVILLSGRDTYALRCSYLHGGEADITEQHRREVLDGFVFMVSEKVNGEYIGSHKIQINNILQLRIDLFCKDICDSVDDWIERNKSNVRIQKSAANMLELHFESVSLNGGIIK